MTLKVADGYKTTRLLSSNVLRGPQGDEHSIGVVSSFADGATDAFSRLRVSNPFALLGLKQLYDSNPLFYDEQEVSGSGTGGVHDPNRASTVLSVSAGTAGKRVKQSKLRGTYQPGKGQLVFATASNMLSGNGVTKAYGYFDDNNGIFYKSQSGTAYVGVRSSSSGGPVDNLIPQSEWNLDTMDGRGPSGWVIDFSKTQILVIDFEWLGVGRIRIGWNIDGKTTYCHEFNNANNLDVVYMSTPNLPIRYEIENDGTGGAEFFETICASLIAEGGSDDVEKASYISRGATPVTLGGEGAFTPILSLRLKAGHNATRVNPTGVDVFMTSSTNFEWRLFINPTLAGADTPTWVPVDNSSLEYDTARDNTNTVTGGYAVAGGYGASTNQSRVNITSQVKSFLTLGFSIDNTPDEYVLAVSNIDGTGGTAYGAITIGEYF